MSEFLSTQPLRFIALGDVFLGGEIDLLTMRKGGLRWGNDGIARLLKKADIVFCNLEAPLTRNDVPYRPNGH